MNSNLKLPPIMANAREDLAGNISGQFSPADWEKILEQARALVHASPKPEPEAWADVIRDFHSRGYWGYVPDFKAPKADPKQGNLGTRFIWYSFRSFLVTKVAVLYFGARYTIDDDPIYTWLFFGSIIFMLLSYGYFLWRHSDWKEERRDEDSGE